MTSSVPAIPTRRERDFGMDGHWQGDEGEAVTPQRGQMPSGIHEPHWGQAVPGSCPTRMPDEFRARQGKPDWSSAETGTQVGLDGRGRLLFQPKVDSVRNFIPQI